MAGKGFWANLSLAPFELKLFIGFAAVVSIASLLIGFLLPDHINEAVIPVTGWSLGLSYLFNLAITLSNLNTRPGNRKRLNIQFGNVLIMVATIAFHLFQMSKQAGGLDDNPYLSISPYRPVWAMIIPSLWILLLLSPNIKKYCLTG